MIKSNRHLKSIDLVEISRSVVESPKMDSSRSKFDDLQISNEFCKNMMNLTILLIFREFMGFGWVRFFLAGYGFCNTGFSIKFWLGTFLAGYVFLAVYGFCNT